MYGDALGLVNLANTPFPLTPGGMYITTKLSGSFIMQNTPTVGSAAGATTIFAITAGGKVAAGSTGLLFPTASLDVTGDIRASTAVTSSIVWANFLVGSGSAPAIFTGSAAGANATASITGTSTAGQITITVNATSTASVNAVIATCKYTGSFITAPYVVLSPANANAASLNWHPYALSAPASFSINTGNLGLTASNAYVWNYHCIA